MKVVILRGISGSGKSTLAKKLYQDTPGFKAIYSADHFFVQTDGSYKFKPAKLGEAHRKCLLLFAKAMESSNDLLIVDNTNTTAMEIAPYAQLALAYGHAVEVITVECDLDVAASRNVHNVPRAVIVAQNIRLQAETKKLRSKWHHKVWNP